MNNIQASNWLGMDNIHRDVEIAPDLLRNTANLDFTARGKLVSRSGYALLSSGSASGGFAFGRYLMFIRGGSLRSLHTETGAETTLFAVSSDRIGRVIIGDYAYISDGVSKWKIDQELQVSAWESVASDDPTFDPRFTADFPACNKLAYWKGRIVGRIGNLVVYSLPFAYGSYDQARNFFPVRGTVDLLHGNDDVLFIGADDVFAVSEFGGAIQVVFPGNIIAAMVPDSSMGEQHPFVSEDYLRSEETRKEIFNALQL